MAANVNLGKTQITDKIRVSSAAIFYDEWFGQRFQFETFIFSEDPAVKTQQIIHFSYPEVGEHQKEIVGKIHNYIANNLKTNFSNQ